MQKTVIVVTKPGLGTTSSDDAEFGIQMIDKFFHTWEGRPQKPHAVCFYTEGVKLLGKNSPVSLSLKLLEGVGVRLLACQTCVDYYRLTDDLAVGELVGMPDIVKVITV